MVHVTLKDMENRIFLFWISSRWLIMMIPPIMPMQ